ncbi:MAG: protein translocase subunit SecD [Phycisphaerales bacterium JB063]
MALLFTIIFFALLGGALVLYVMNQHWWKVSLIAAVIFGAVAMLWVPGLYGPGQRLKGGIDLVGGTTLVYDVSVPEGQLPGDVIDRTIEVLADRVDPTGTRNLVWRRIAGQRIEVQMALATQNVRDARKAYEDAEKLLLEGNLTRGALDTALRSEDRDAQLAKLANGNSDLRAQLDALAELFDAEARADEAYLAAQALWAEVPPELRDENQNVLRAMEDAESFHLNAEDTFLREENALLGAFAFNLAEFEMLVDLPVVQLSEAQKEAGEVAPREQRLAELKESYPNHAERLQAAYDALLAYEAVKGPMDDPQDLIALLQGSGVLEFRIAANPDENYRSAIVQLDTEGPRAGIEDLVRWFEIDDLTKYVDEEEQREEVNTWLRDSLSGDAEVASAAREAITAFFESYRDVVARPYAGRLYVLLHNADGLAMTRADEWGVTSVRQDADELGRPSVLFFLDGRGSGYMQRMTGENVGEPMAVLLDNKVLTTPNIRQSLSSTITITGDFSPEEIRYLIQTMQAGALEGQLSEMPVGQKTTGPQLGEDNLKAGIEAALIALIAVGVFMVFYYFFGGVVANFALAVNMVLILGIMAMIQSTFTLPGIAGMVLTIGMAVDANVLIFERIREELKAGANLEVAVRQGYGKVLSTILDANITTLITCVILGYTATSEVKGFAVVLGIGILATLFTALFCTKTIIDLYVRFGKAKSLHMLPLSVPGIERLLSPQVNWIKLSKVLVPVSLLLLVLGMAETLGRGSDMLDIEFRSGTQVGFEFKPTGDEDASGDPILETLEIAQVRERIDLYGIVAESIQEGEAQDTVSEELARIKELIGSDQSVDVIYNEVKSTVAQAVTDFEQRTENYYGDIAARIDMPGQGDLLAVLVKNILTGGTQADVADELKLLVDGLEEPQSADAYYAQVVEAAQAKALDMAEPEPLADYADFDGENTVTTGEQDGAGYSVSMLITDSSAVTGLLKLAFADLLETTQVVSYAGAGLSAQEAPQYVQAITNNSLTRVFNGAYRLASEHDDVTEFRGGVAIVIDAMSPGQSIEQLEERISRTRRQPPHDLLGARTVEIVPLERTPQGGTDAEGNLLYESVVVLVKDDHTDYDTSIADFDNAEGLAATEMKLIDQALQRDSSFSDVTVFNSQVSGTMKQTALVAMLLSLLAVVVYIWVRFGSIRYGIAAIAALVHDVAITLGLLALAGWFYARAEDSVITSVLMLEPFKVNLAIIAALLTIVGYSLNDTIVVFDRIRENRGRLSRATPDIINDSINQTVSRTVITSFTTFLAVIVLYVLGGPGVHGFAFAMVIGVLVGTYSSIAIASPILTIGTKGQGPAGGPMERSPAPAPGSDEVDIVSEPAAV